MRWGSKEELNRENWERISFMIMMVLLVARLPQRAAGAASIPDSSNCLGFDSFHRLNEWSSISDCSKQQSNLPELQDVVVFPSAYQRSSSYSSGWKEDKRWKIVIQSSTVTLAGSEVTTFIYDPFLNFWTVPHVSIQPFLLFSAVTTWCNTNIIVFGGRLQGSIAVILSNETWTFDGAKETWHLRDVALWTKDQFIAGRYMHTAVTIRQPLSNCTCQESVLVYGGRTQDRKCLGDLWEMRCIVDSSGKNVFYWMPLLREDHTMWPQARFGHTAVDYNKTVMYMWGGLNCVDHGARSYSGGIWEYNLTSRMWRHYLGDAGVNALLSQTHHAFYVMELDRIVTVTIDSFYVFDLSNGSLHFEINNRMDRYKRYDVESWTVAGEAVIICGYSAGTKTMSVSIAAYVNESAGWKWTVMPESLASPPTDIEVSHTQFADGSLCVFALYSPDITTVWQFDLQRAVWFQTASPVTPGFFPFPLSATFNTDMIVLYKLNIDPRFVPSAAKQHLKYTSSSLWIYHTTIRRWTLCLEVSDQHEVPVPRHDGTMVDMQNGSLLMFGGDTYRSVVNDLWRMDVRDQEEYRPVQEECVRWVLLSRNGASILSPSPRRSHAAFAFNGDLFVFGGIGQTVDPFHIAYYHWLHLGIINVSLVFTDMWQFRSDSRTWSEVDVRGMIPVVSGFEAIAQWGTKVIFVPDYKFNFFTMRRTSKWFSQRRPLLNFTVVFDVLTSEWSKIADFPPFQPSAATFWKGKLVVAKLPTPFDHVVVVDFQTAPIEFILLNPACPSGYYSPNWKNESCEKCSKGSFTNVALGATHCSFCAVGLTTTSTKATQLSECVCRNDYCNKGTCAVDVRGDQMRSAVCQCKTGYTGTTCSNPSYYMIGLVTAILLLVILLLFLFVTKMLKYRRQKKDVEAELSSAHRVWNIDMEEIELEDRIDGDTPGSYGEVYKATYRNMMVAVKHLNAVMLTDQTIRKEFEREVEVMRAIRHPNIVMFFGAGTIEQPDGGNKVSFPFLVIEFMSRGTLNKILDSPHISLSHRDRVGFALDAARGMQYLHSLSPPRIHRDMKSANLLVSRDWKIKVSDFGSARVVRRQGERQPTDVSRSQRQDEDDNAPLLGADSLLTRDTGTILWRAPEIFALGNYGTSADVYSYGIVLWEILCRENPYDEHEFQWIEDVSRAVQRGIRPSIPQSAPFMYVNLMKECWHTDPDRRPTFTYIVNCLSAMETVLSATETALSAPSAGEGEAETQL